MKKLKALNPDQVNETTQEVFAAIEQKVGMLPNLYATMANSPNLLQGFLAFEAILKEGDFSSKENEAIALAVSQENNCNYCLSAHSTIGKMVGYTDEEVMDIRKGTTSDSKLNALLTLTRELTEKRGKASNEAIEAFLSAGYTHKAFAELIGMVAIRSITNYIFSNGDFEIDFPRAIELSEATAA